MAGEKQAWQELFAQEHYRLLASIRSMYGRAVNDSNKVDEIAARVWYELMLAGGELLGQFDAGRGCRLSTFVGTVARNMAKQMFRADRRRRLREAAVARREQSEGGGPRELAWRVAEFVGCLTQREREFCLEVLLSRDSAGERFTDANSWQLRSRIRRKLREFARD
ncbi:MAG: hypothetical protein HYS13_19245 [Planctomycetia bacterium]|nr:hypothetical protein [Planctomycetia bacterium]